jgi:hypothetical protein
VRVPPDLTSLFDVLFIVIFAVLIRGAATQQAAAKTAPPPKPVTPPPVTPVMQAAAQLKTRALAQLDAELATRPTVIARIARDGRLVRIESGDKQLAVDTPLLEQSADPDVALAYLGDRSADLHLCKLVALHLGREDLADYLMIFAPDSPHTELPHALFDGLHRDVDRCQLEQHGLAVIVEPTP